MLRRLSAAGLVVGLVLSLAAVTPAVAAPYRKPVDPYPDLPSMQYKTWAQSSAGPVQVGGYQPGSPGYAEEQAAMRAYMNSHGFPPPAATSAARTATANASRTGTVVVIDGGTHVPGKPVTITNVPKPITAPSAIARGAGGPIVAGLSGGFAIGTAGLAFYGALTGDDPLDDLCGTPVEGLGYIMYLGMMPDCAAVIAGPNGDLTPGTAVQLGTYGRFYPGTGSSWCGPRTQLPAGYEYRFFSANSPLGGQAPWRTSGTTWPSVCAQPVPMYGFSLTVTDTLHRIDVKNTTTNQVVQSGVPTAQEADPDRTPSCSIGWDDGTTTTGAGPTYRESAGFPTSAGGMGCAQAWAAKPGGGFDFMPEEIAVESDDGTTTTEVLNQTAPTLNAEEKAALRDTTGKGLQLWKATESCMTWAADCDGWWDETDHGTSTTTDYRCTYGNAVVTLTQCYVYARTFDADAAVDSPTVTDPVTGDTTNWTSNGGQNSTDPASGPTPGDECMDQWATAPNPVEWVLHPVKCALVWAFVPRTQKFEDFQQKLDDEFSGSSLGQLQAAIAGVALPFADLADGDCGGLILPYPKVGAGWSVTIDNAAILPACPGDFFAPWAPWFYWLLSGGLVVGAFFMVKAYLDRTVGLS